MSSDLSSDFDTVPANERSPREVHELWGDDVKQILDEFEQDRLLTRAARLKIDGLIKGQYPSAKSRIYIFTDIEPHYFTLWKKTVFVHSPSVGGFVDVPLMSLRTPDLKERAGVSLDKLVPVPPNLLRRFEDAIREKSREAYESMDSMTIDLDDLDNELLH